MKTKLIAVRLGSKVGISPVDDGVLELDKIISNVIGVLTLVAFIFFVLQIIFAGYAFISGQGDEKKVESARKRLTDGILGITIVVISFGITALLAKLLGLGNIFDLNRIFNGSPSLDGVQEGVPVNNPLQLQGFVNSINKICHI